MSGLAGGGSIGESSGGGGCACMEEVPASTIAAGLGGGASGVEETWGCEGPVLSSNGSTPSSNS